MLKFGTVEEIEGYKVKLNIEDGESFKTNWLYVPQKYTVNGKSKQMPEIKQLVVAILNDEMTEGIVLGGIYNDKDIPSETLTGDEFTQFADGASFSHNENTFNLKVENLIVDGNIVCTKDIQNKTGTLDSVRQHSNNHVHTDGNNGGNTGTPTERV